MEIPERCIGCPRLEQAQTQIDDLRKEKHVLYGEAFEINEATGSIPNILAAQDLFISMALNQPNSFHEHLEIVLEKPEADQEQVFEQFYIHFGDKLPRADITLEHKPRPNIIVDYFESVSEIKRQEFAEEVLKSGDLEKYLYDSLEYRRIEREKLHSLRAAIALRDNDIENVEVSSRAILANCESGVSRKISFMHLGACTVRCGSEAK